jgi:hypothetical protein
MPETKPQTKENHTRLHPLFHLFFIPLVLTLFLRTTYQLVSKPGSEATLHFLLTLGVGTAGFLARTYSLKVQDRVIRLEERLRLAFLLPSHLLGRIPEFSEQQLIALRFASDEELPALAEHALIGQWEPKAIKAAIQRWRPDYWRV